MTRSLNGKHNLTFGVCQSWQLDRLRQLEAYVSEMDTETAQMRKRSSGRHQPDHLCLLGAARTEQTFTCSSELC